MRNFTHRYLVRKALGERSRGIPRRHNRQYGYLREARYDRGGRWKWLNIVSTGDGLWDYGCSNFGLCCLSAVCNLPSSGWLCSSYSRLSSKAQNTATFAVVETYTITTYKTWIHRSFPHEYLQWTKNKVTTFYVARSLCYFIHVYHKITCH
jgi:hypothetical protein